MRPRAGGATRLRFERRGEPLGASWPSGLRGDPCCAAGTGVQLGGDRSTESTWKATAAVRGGEQVGVGVTGSTEGSARLGVRGSFGSWGGQMGLANEPNRSC